MTVPVRLAHDAFFWLNNLLVRGGVTSPEIRVILCWQLIGSVICLVVGVFFWLATVWIFWFGAGLALGTWNFYGLSKFIIRMIPHGWSNKVLVGQLLRTNGRLLFTGVFLYVALVWCSAPAFALVAGLLVVMFPIVLIGFLHRTRKH